MPWTPNFSLPLPPDSTYVKDTAGIIRDTNTRTDEVLTDAVSRVAESENAAQRAAADARAAADLSAAPADDAVAALLAGGSSATAGIFYTALHSAHPGPLKSWLAALRNQKTAPAVYVSLGSSTAGGHGASSHEKSWIQRVALRFGPRPAAGLAQPKPANGVQVYNAAIGGTQSTNYLTDETTAQVIALKPHLISHMVGSNDWAVSRSPAEYKAQLRARVLQLRAALPNAVQMLVHQQNRFDTPNPAPKYPWPAYGAAMAEIAAEFPGTVLFVDLAAHFESLGLDYNPSVLWGGDRIHLNDDGHRVLAELMADAIGAPAMYLPRRIFEAVPAGGTYSTATNLATLTIPPRAWHQQIKFEVSLFSSVASGAADFELQDISDPNNITAVRAFRVAGASAVYTATATAELPAHQQGTYRVRLARMDGAVYISANAAWHSITADVSPH